VACASLGLPSTPQVRIDVVDHAAIENGFAITPTIAGAVQTDDAALEIYAVRRA
jgi:hypothetical protein